MPPSANRSAWTRQHDRQAQQPIQGPTSTAARAPPIRWPLVPLATGKLSIWSTKTKAPTSPARGTSRSLSSEAALRRLAAMAPADTIRPRPRWRH